jgi:hypothetical protein
VVEPSSPCQAADDLFLVKARSSIIRRKIQQIIHDTQSYWAVCEGFDGSLQIIMLKVRLRAELHSRWDLPMHSSQCAAAQPVQANPQRQAPSQPQQAELGVLHPGCRTQESVQILFFGFLL